MTEMPLDGLRILLVEDNFYLATDAAMTIEGAGGKVVGPFATAEDARDALDAEAPTWRSATSTLVQARPSIWPAIFIRSGCLS